MRKELNVTDSLSALNLASLPTMPVVAARIHQMLEDEDVDIAKLAQVIQSDPAVVARMVKMANSSFYGSRREIKTITAAIMTIGLSAVRGTVLQAALQELYQPFGPTEEMLWEHANAVAMASRFLASHLRPAMAEEAFLAGLLHDIGMLVLNWSAPEQFQLLLTREELDSEANFATEEFEIFKVSHGEVGGWVLRNWEFPDELIAVAKDHHNFQELTPDQGTSSEQPSSSWLTTLVSLADVICLKAGVGYQRNEVAEWEDLPHLSLLRLDAHRVDQLSNEFLEKYIEEWQYMVS
jgi:putative nucleotidyltransferase with HDIG domain